MKKFISILMFLIFSGCAFNHAFLPLGLPNVKNYTKCTPVYSTHHPAAYMELKALLDAVKENPSILDKTINLSNITEMITKNAPALGSGVAAIVTALMGKLSTASIVGSTIMGSLQAFGDMRSEDKTQDRVDVCMPDSADVVSYKDAYAHIIVVKGNQTQEVLRALSGADSGVIFEKAKKPQ